VFSFSRDLFAVIQEIYVVWRAPQVGDMKPTDKDWMLRDTRTIESLEDMKKLDRGVYALIDYFDLK
jgi:hypothetical protein